jgi:hypothetical protein
MTKAERGVGVRDDLSRGELEELERRLAGEPGERSAAEVDDPLISPLHERSGGRTPLGENLLSRGSQPLHETLVRG